MICPRWVDARIQPIAIRDVLRYLLAAMDVGEDHDGGDHDIDIGGPDVLTYRQMMQRHAEVAWLPRRLIFPVPVLTPRLSSHWVNLVTPVPFGLARPLVESLGTDVVVRDGHETGADLDPRPALSLDQAIRLALQRIADHEVETSWREADLVGRSAAEPYPGDPDWAGGVLLRPGDALDLWRVEAVAPPSVLRLRAEMKVPGQAWLEFRITPGEEGRTILQQRALFAPRGLLGRLCWWAMLPFHGPIFSSMLTTLAGDAVALDAAAGPAVAVEVSDQTVAGTTAPEARAAS